ncbi:MAG: hypothetical protein M3O67_04910 [Bacteroidota bacterium]|nr:hypothetical protein [Bacteroidota bacterium]
MTLKEFQKSLLSPSPPINLSSYFQSLWYDEKGNWQKAHNIIQDIEDKTAAWIHAYLHRKEGDKGNARYWYNRAGKPMPDYSLQQEWQEIVIAIL